MAQLRSAVVAQQQGDLAGAIDEYRATLALAPDLVDGHILLARALRDAGQLAAAADSFRAALRVDGERVDGHNGLGLTLQAAGDLDAAVGAFEAALKLAPDHENTLFNLAGALRLRGDHRAAIDHYRAVIAAQPNDAEALCQLAALLRHNGEPEQAIALLSAALPSRDILNELGAAYVDSDDLAKAIEAFEAAVQLDQAWAPSRFNLGVCLKMVTRLGDSEQQLREAVSLAPDDAEGHVALANTLKAQGRVREAIDRYRAALRARPDHAAAHSNLLLCLNYRQDEGPQRVADEHRSWAERHTEGALPPLFRRQRGEPNRRLRVGYLSADLRSHSVAYFMEPLLRAHDRKRVELFAYSGVKRPDATSERLRRFFDHWLDTTAPPLSDTIVAERIAADGIDVLIDVNGHTDGNRLRAMARRPAPVQASYLGYPNSTGLQAIELRFTDELADPRGAQAHHTEKLVRLEGGFLCYQPSAEAPAICPPPLLERGHITFGSFNALPKITEELVALWADVLTGCRGSRLLLKNPSLSDAQTRDRYLALFEREGIEPARIELRGFVASEVDHLASYGDIDIALDSFPYNGTTTSCEAMWMGVPLLTLVGDVHASRVGLSLLTQLGLAEELCRHDPDAFVERALELAAAPDLLARWRATLRDTMATSPLCDGRRLARQLERTFAELLEERAKTAAL